MRFQTVARVLVLTSLIISVPALASAQGATEVGAKIGFNVSSIKVKFDDATVTSDGRAGIVVGAWVARDFNARVGFQGEVLIEQKGGEFSIDDDIGFGDEASFKLTYLSFPALARINVPAGTSMVRFLTGPSFNFHINESIKVGGVELDGDDVDLETFEMGWVIGGQVEIRKFVIDARYIWGLTNINASADDDEDEPTVKNNAFQLTFGYRFK